MALSRGSAHRLKTNQVKRPGGALKSLRRLLSPPSRQLPVLFLALSTLLGAGVDMVRSLDCCIHLTEADYPRLADDLRDISRRIGDGASLSSAFSAYGVHFSPLHINLIRTAEASGKMAEVFTALARREEEWYVTRHKIYTALTYPALMAVAVAVMVLIVLPVTVTSTLPLVAGNQPLPWLTAMLLRVCEFMRTPAFWVAVLASGWMVGRVTSNTALREAFLRRLHSTPVLGTALQAAACQAFFYALHLQTQAGQNLNTSLRSAADVSGNRVFQDSIARQSRRFREGEIELFEVFEAFEPMVAQSIVTLQETGAPDKIFPVMAKFYQQQLENYLEKALALLNPTLTFVMGGIIGLVVIATALPIVRMADSL